MKQLFFFLLAITTCTSYSQVLNGSFENGWGADLSNWEWTCGAQSAGNPPPGGGNWCIKVFGGNTQGCFPGYAYQKLPSVKDGDAFTLSGWFYTETSPQAGFYFGKINKGVITTTAGVTGGSTSWQYINGIQSNFSLSAGDTAVLILYGGLTGGPTQGYGYFDLVSLQPVTTGISFSEEKNPVRIFPNPFSTEATLFADHLLNDATLTVYNSYGQVIKQTEDISGQEILFLRDHLPGGLYFFQLTEDNKVIATERVLVAE